VAHIAAQEKDCQAGTKSIAIIPRAYLVSRAEGWLWSSLARRAEGRGLDLLDAWPVPLPGGWLEDVNGV